MKRNLLVLIMILLVLSACNNPDPPAPTDLPTAFPSDTPQPTTTPEPTPAPEEFTQYRFEMTLDYNRHTAQVVQTIDYINKTNFSLPSILLVIPPRAFGNSYDQTGLAGENITGFSEEGIRTTLQLAQPLEPGQRLTINLSFNLAIPQREGSFGWSQRQLNLSNWYPYIPPLKPDQSWISHDPFIDQANIMVGEYVVNEIADFYLTLHLVENLPNLLVASGAKAMPIPDGMSYSQERARSLSFSLSNQYHHQQVEHNGLLIQAYVFQYQSEKAPAVLQIASQAMDLYAEIFGPYHYDQVSIVSADFLHNMELDGIVLISSSVVDFYDNTPENNLTILVPHELAHQWFYSQVGNDHALEPWLDETLATYSEYLFYEHYYPELADWWWDNRVYAHAHTGFVNNSIYDAGSYENYRSSVYLNGAIFMHDLRITMGDQAFMSALKDYVALNNLKITTKTDFVSIFQAANPNVNLQEVYARYFKE